MMQLFPDEIVLEILSNVDVEDLVTFTEVSHRLRQLTLDKEIVRSLNFSRYTTTRRSLKLLQYSSCIENTQIVDFSDCYWLNGDDIIDGFRNLRNLSQLYLVGCRLNLCRLLRALEQMKVECLSFTLDEDIPAAIAAWNPRKSAPEIQKDGFTSVHWLQVFVNHNGTQASFFIKNYFKNLSLLVIEQSRPRSRFSAPFFRSESYESTTVMLPPHHLPLNGKSSDVDRPATWNQLDGCSNQDTGGMEIWGRVGGHQAFRSEDWLDGVTALQIGDIFDLSLLEKARDLKKIKIKDAAIVRMNEIACLASHQKHLRELEVGQICRRGSETFGCNSMDALCDLKGLRKLSLPLFVFRQNEDASRCYSDTDSLDKFAENLQHISTLKLIDYSEYGTPLTSVSHFLHLEELILDGITYTDETFLIKVAKNCKKLKHLNLVECEVKRKPLMHFNQLCEALQMFACLEDFRFAQYRSHQRQDLNALLSSIWRCSSLKRVTLICKHRTSVWKGWEIPSISPPPQFILFAAILKISIIGVLLLPDPLDELRRRLKCCLPTKVGSPRIVLVSNSERKFGSLPRIHQNFALGLSTVADPDMDSFRPPSAYYRPPS